LLVFRSRAIILTLSCSLSRLSLSN
jgi:hypothetical protein